MIRAYPLLLMLLFLGCSSTTSVDPYEIAIGSLTLGTPDEETDAAVELLESGGVDAFDALLAHLDDETDAADRFIGEIGYFGDVPAEPFHVSIGYACFDMLQYQIEGCWPKSYRQYYALTNKTIADWLSTRRTKSLNQLRVECAEISLEKARETNRTTPTEHSSDSVQFLIGNLAKVRAATGNAE